MTLPHLMMKIWDGDEYEYFTYTDMNRVEYNANILAREAGTDEVSYIEVTRASQFRYDEAQALENHIQAVADAVGVTVSIESAWTYNRPLTYADFERWEANLWAIYTALGGVGERIQAGKVLVIYQATLFASAWLGDGPYHIDLDAPAVYADTEAVAFLPATASAEERMAEYNGLLRVSYLSDRKVRIWALRRKPLIDLPLRLAIGGLQMYTEVTLSASGWTGSGPWTQSVDLGVEVEEAVIGPCETTTDDGVLATARAGIVVSAISGTTITLRALRSKPSIDLTLGLSYNETTTE